jgi:hypothetical protein
VAAQNQKIEYLFAAQVTGQNELKKLTDAVDGLRKEMEALKTANGPLVDGMGKVEGAARKSGKGLDEASKAIRNHRQGVQQAGMQLNDFATSVSTGASPLQAFNQQIGQIGYAMSMMGGVAGRIGSFLAGPWGALVIGAAMAVSFFVEKLMAGEKAAAQLEIASSALSSGQSALGEMFDMTSGKIKSNTLETRLNTLAKIENLKATAADQKATLTSLNKKIQGVGFFNNVMDKLGMIGTGFYAEGLGSAGGLLPGLTGGMAQIDKNRANLFKFSTDVEKAMLDVEKGVAGADKEIEKLFRRVDKLDVRGTRFNKTELRQALLSGTSGAALEALIPKLEKSVNQGSVAAGLLKPDEKGSAAAARRLAAEAKRIAKEAEALREKELKSVEAFMDKIGKVGMKELPAYQRDIAQLEKDFFELSKAGQAATIAPFKAAIESIEMQHYSDMLKADAKNAEAMVQSALPNLEELNVSKEMEDIISKADEMKKSFEAIGESVSEAFKGMLTGAMSWKDGMRSLIGSVIDQLWKLFVVQKIVGLVTGALTGGATAAPNAASVTGNIGMSSPGNFRPLTLRAFGGSVDSNKPYMVGERGPELFVPGGNGTIIPNGNMRGGGGGSPISISVDARGSSDPAAVRAQVQQGILEAAPAIIAAAESRTIAGLRRPRLGGAMQ